jgi:hypothetical protein
MGHYMQALAVGPAPHLYYAFRLGIRKYRIGGVLSYATMQTWCLCITGDCAKLFDRGRCQLFV